MKVLVVEDEIQVSNSIRQGLEEKAFRVDLVDDGLRAQRMALGNEYDIVLLDIVIPGMNGIELCRSLKVEKPNLPILMLTTLATTSDKVMGFDAGADDYLLKPFEFEELVARIRALVRRPSMVSGTNGMMLRFEDLKLDLEKKVAIRCGKNIKLSAKEFALLGYFMRNARRVISRAELAEKIWNIKFDTGTNVVEVYMNFLRNKIDRDCDVKLLQTRIGMGYVLSKDE